MSENVPFKPDILKIEQRLFAETSFDMAVYRACERIKPLGFDWKSFNGVFAWGKALEKRSKELLSGKSAKLNRESIITKFFKENFPNYKKKKYYPENLGFYLPLVENVSFYVDFEKSRGLIGKEFQLNFGVEIYSPYYWGYHQTRTILAPFGFNRIGPSFAYFNEEELKAILVGLLPYMQKVLPIYLEEVGKYFSIIPNSFPGDAPFQGALTAREGYLRALDTVRLWDSNPILTGVAIYPALGSIWGPTNRGVGEYGKLTDRGRIRVAFYSPIQEELGFVTIPYCGPIEFNIQPIDYNRKINAIDPAWLDSPQVLEMINKFGLLEIWKNPDYQLMLFQLSCSNEPIRDKNGFVRERISHWKCHLILEKGKEKRREDINFNIDATNGELIV